MSLTRKSMTYTSKIDAINISESSYNTCQVLDTFFIEDYITHNFLK